MGPKRTKYDPGSIFVLPLFNKQFGVGIITLIRRGTMVGHFLDIMLESIPTLEQVESYFEKKDNIAHIEKFGVLGLDKMEWIILGKMKNYENEAWKVNAFSKVDVISNESFLVHYDDNLNYLYDEKVATLNEKLYPYDGVAGYKLMEDKLTDILTGKKLGNQQI
jgi:hypothetical protein